MVRYRSTSGEAIASYSRREVSRTSCSGTLTPKTPVNFTGGTWWTKEVWDIPPSEGKRLRCSLTNGTFLPLHPFEIKSVEETKTPGHISHETYALASPYCLLGKQDPDWGYTIPTWQVDVPAIDQGKLDAASLEAAAKSKTATYEVLTDLAEMHKTVSFVAETLSGLARTLSTSLVDEALLLLKRHRYNAAHALGAAWLEMQFGVKPIILSTQDALKAVEEKANRIRSINIGKGGLSESLSANFHHTVTNPSGTQTVTTDQQLSGTRVYRGTWYSTIEAPWLKPVGFDPVVATWEILPLSWVVDYFFTIGSWLKAMSPYTHGRLVQGCVSVKDTYTKTNVTGYSYQGSDAVRHEGGGTSTTSIKVEHYRRVLATELPLPGWSAQVSTGRALNLIALTTQLVTATSLGGFLKRARSLGIRI